MKEIPVRSFNYKLLLPRLLHDLPDMGKIADSLGLFALMVLALGLLSFLGGTSMTVQDSAGLQSWGFLLLGVGQLFFLRKKLPILVKRKIWLFSPEGWSYIRMLCVLLLVILFLLYLIVDASHLFMSVISLLAFLLPFTLLNAWELLLNGSHRREETEGKRIKTRIGWLGAASLFIVFGLIFLPGRQTPVSRSGPETPTEKLTVQAGAYELAGQTGKEGQTRKYELVGNKKIPGGTAAALSEGTARLLELDARFTRLARLGTVISPSDLEQAGADIKTQEYALGRLLDSLDNQGRSSDPLTPAFRSLLAGHRILSRFQNDNKR